MCCHLQHQCTPSLPPTPTVLKLIVYAPPTPGARRCTGAWSCVRPTQRCPRWGSRWPPSAWRDRTLCWQTTPLCWPASASAAIAGRSSACAYTGGFACYQVSQTSAGAGLWGGGLACKSGPGLPPAIHYLVQRTSILCVECMVVVRTRENKDKRLFGSYLTSCVCVCH